MDGAELVFEDEALRAIASLAIERNTGARGLRSIIEEVMTELMYELPSKEGIAKITITKDAVLGLTKPKYSKKKASRSNSQTA